MTDIDHNFFIIKLATLNGVPVDLDRYSVSQYMLGKDIVYKSGGFWQSAQFSPTSISFKHPLTHYYRIRLNAVSVRLKVRYDNEEITEDDYEPAFGSYDGAYAPIYNIPYNMNSSGSALISTGSYNGCNIYEGTYPISNNIEFIKENNKIHSVENATITELAFIANFTATNMRL